MIVSLERIAGFICKVRGLATHVSWMSWKKVSTRKWLRGCPAFFWPLPLNARLPALKHCSATKRWQPLPVLYYAHEAFAHANVCTEIFVFHRQSKPWIHWRPFFLTMFLCPHVCHHACSKMHLITAGCKLFFLSSWLPLKELLQHINCGYCSPMHLAFLV